MRRATLGERVRYRADQVLARGPASLALVLVAAALLLAVGLALLVVVTGTAPTAEGGQAPGLAALVWAALLHTLDTGEIENDAGSPFFVGAMLTVAVAGIVLVSALTAILTNGIDNRFRELRKGRSLVVEHGHTVILGWSPAIFSILAELALANASRPRPRIAVLADRDKVEMEDEIHQKLRGRLGRTRVICRTGSPIDPHDLEIVNPHDARAIVVLAPPTGDADAQVIKTILALTNTPHRRPGRYHIVAELHDPKNLEVARLVGRDDAQFVLGGDLIARIAAQTCRQSGLSVIYTELLDFEGDEIYFKEEPGLVGRAFGDALFAYEDAALIGLRTADGQILLAPPDETRVGPGDQVIVIAADDGAIRLAPRAEIPIEADAIRARRHDPPRPERTLLLGWNRRAPTVINELDSYVAPGSELTVVADAPQAEAELRQRCAGLRHQTLCFRAGDTTDRRTLEQLAVHTYQHVVVLGYSDTLEPPEADARTLVTLLHVRDLADRQGSRFSLVSEMLDVRDRDLPEVTRADDFIVSEKLVSLMLAQLSENRELEAVFNELFDPEGTELYLKPAGDYVEPGRAVNFITVVASARRRGEVAIGYRLAALATDAARTHGVVVNPKKSAPIALAEGDRVIVLARE